LRPSSSPATPWLASPASKWLASDRWPHTGSPSGHGAKCEQPRER
jgi:hypothetical protein